MARTDQHVRAVPEGDGQCESAAEPREHGLHRVFGRSAVLDLAADEMRDHFAVGLAFEDTPLGDELFAQGAEILDDPVMHQRHMRRGVGMRVGRGRRAMSSPARVRDADCTGCRMRGEFVDEVGELSRSIAETVVAA